MTIIHKSPVEQAMGRLMRAPDGHEGAAPAAEAPAAAPAEGAAAPEPAPAPQEPAEPKTTTEEDLAREFGQIEEPAEPAEGVAPAEGDPAPAAPAEEKKPEPSDAVAEANRRAEEAERRAEFWRGKAEGAPEPAQPTAAPAEDVEPDATKYEFGEADPKYVADLARFHARQEFRTQQETAALNAEVATIEAKYEKNVASSIERYPDFQEKVTKAADNQEFPCSPVMALGIKSSDYGPDIAYHLATNKDEAIRIDNMSPLEQAREFGRLEYRFETEAKARQAPPANSNPAPRASAAPVPPKTLARGAGGKFTADADTDDFAAFERDVADPVLARKR